MELVAPSFSPGLGEFVKESSHQIVSPTKRNTTSVLSVTKEVVLQVNAIGHLDDDQKICTDKRDWVFTSNDIECLVQESHPGAQIHRDNFGKRQFNIGPNISKNDDNQRNLLETTGQNSFWVEVQQNKGDSFFFQAIRIDQHKHFVTALRQWLPKETTKIVSVGDNLIYVEDHRQITRLIDEMKTSYNEAVAKAACEATICMVFHLLEKGYRLFDLAPENILLVWDSNHKNVVDVSLANLSGLKHVDDFDRLSEDGDMVNIARLVDLLIGPEVSNMKRCTEKNYATGKHTAPTTYASLKHLDVFRLALLCTQIFLQNTDSAKQLLEVIEGITVDQFDSNSGECDNKNDEKDEYDEYHDVYYKSIKHHLSQQLTESDCGISHKAGNLLSFLMQMFGTIEKSELTEVEYSSQIETTRPDDPEELLRMLDKLDFQYLARIECTDDPSSQGEEQVKRMLKTVYGVTGDPVKRSNAERFLGDKSCVTFETDLKPMKRMFRVFLKSSPRWRDVFSLYKTIQEQQKQGAKLARKYFPRVFRIEGKANWFVVEEACVDGMELIDHLNRLRERKDLRNRKKEQLRIVEQLFEAVALLHEWGFIHGDIGNDNFMVADGTIKVIDNESCVYFGETDEYVDIGPLHLWSKERYRSFEHVSYRWHCQNNRKRPLMTLKQLDEFALGVLVSETLTLLCFDRSSCFDERTGHHNVELFQRTVWDFHWYSLYARLLYSSAYESIFRQEMDILMPLFEGYVQENGRLCSCRESVASLLPRVRDLQVAWLSILARRDCFQH